MYLKSCLIILSVIYFVQSGTKPSSDFETLLEQSREELKLKTEAHQVWGFGKFDRWDLDQDVGDLVFTNADGTKAVAPAQIIGDYYTVDHTWMWAWANGSINDSLKKDSLKVKAYGEEHHIQRLTTGKWVGTKEEAWDMTALAVKICNEQGAYVPVVDKSALFIAFGKVQVSKGKK